MRKWLGRLTLSLVGVAVVALAVAAFQYRQFSVTPMAIQQEYALHVTPGSNLRRVAEQLQRDGLIEDALLLRALGRISGQASQIKAGEYRLAPGTTPPQLLAQLVAGEVVQYSLTLIEGWNFRQLMDAVRSHGALEQTLDGLSDAQIMAKLGAPELHPEGQFYPDTYQFPRGTTDLAFLQRAFDHMQQRLAAEWAKREPGLPVESPYEALVLASIIERETGVPSERQRIAGVFVRRLQQGMRLQTDPTVIYGMGERYQGDIRYSDLRRDTPYNTYTRHGLPPTPIAMPSGAAIHAALNPAKGKELYFVSRGDGSHHFSASLKEHNAAVRRYQLGGRGE
jgi:UPF0755 protein